MLEPTPNLPLLRKVVDHITSHPDEWNQSTWGSQTPKSSCGTAFCIAGHAAIISGMEPVWIKVGDAAFMHEVKDGEDYVYVGDAAQHALGLNDQERSDLFRAQNTRADVQAVAERIAARGGEQL